MKTTGQPQRHARHVRGGNIQTNLPKAYRRSQAAHKDFETNVNETIALANTLMRIGAAVTAFLFMAFLVVVLVTVATL